MIKKVHFLALSMEFGALGAKAIKVIYSGEKGYHLSGQGLFFEG